MKYEILDRLKNPEAVAALSGEEKNRLADELRRLIIKRVSLNGGHLASNLGTIELTLALLSVFNFSHDKVIWDVGHQAYAYRILTGRLKQFSTLRQKAGMAGFPKREESSYDAFNTGHSSTSISAALGLARGLKMQGDNSKVLAVIGDGALTGGMVYEAMNNIRLADDNLIVILNDNEMSIDRNVGSLAAHLNRLRVRPGYLQLKNKTKRHLQRLPILGQPLSRLLTRLKRTARRWVRPKNSIFETFGFRYYGPIDGHDLPTLERFLRAASYHKGPVLLHILTQKGRGYAKAEGNPAAYHGVAPFEVEKGVSVAGKATTGLKDLSPAKKTTLPNSCYNSYSAAFADALLDLAESEPRITALTAAMAGGTGLTAFAARYPERFFDVGIAEQHAVTMAAGLACAGRIPVVAIYSTFLQRAVDQVLHDVVYQGLHVIFAIDRAGLVGEDGETHQGIYDRAWWAAMPGVTVLEPRDYGSLQAMLSYAVHDCTGPVMLRYPRGKNQCPPAYATGVVPDLPLPRPELLRRGLDLTVISSGSSLPEVLAAADLAKTYGLQVAVIDARAVKPLDIETIFSLADPTGALLVVEEVVFAGSMTAELAGAVAARQMADTPGLLFQGITLPDRPVAQQTVAEARSEAGLDRESILGVIREMVQAKPTSAGRRGHSASIVPATQSATRLKSRSD